ncbi:MAG: serine hydrolase, partial [Candidatus Eremiobacteraeota bacterium]|nr:serine hydrolase [Candidatus Eremiobacteraeota bacterium]
MIGLLMLLCAFPLEPTALDALVEGAIGQGQMAGAVLLVGRGREVLYHKAYGFRQLEPERLPMTTDTLFDVASLTKPMATGLAINWLFEQGKLSPTDHVADYLPQVDPRLTVEQLLLHRAGFAPDPPLEADWDQILASRPLGAPGQDFLYSDIGYLILGKLVEKVDGRPLDRLCAEEFYAPLGMVDTGFNPAPRERVAATEGQLSGRVHDPRAARLGGVAGHAGLFSTTSDTARFAVMLLEGGANVLKPETVRAMTANHQGRSFGFDVDTSFSTARGDRFPVGTSFGHTGFTGTSLWVDPASGLYVILFTNRLHPDGKGSVVELRHQVATAVADQLLGPPVKLGIDRLVEQDFAPLRGHRVGLVTNHTGRDSQGRRTIDLLARAEGVELVCLFSPEHGLGG